VIFTAPVENHRGREKGVIVYPVYSRRSRGLSVGINLFPDKKSCPFDCPYCEVFPFPISSAFSLRQMEEELRFAIAGVLKQNIPIKDICFSGNGEPSLSAALPDALKFATIIRNELAPSAKLVLITNGAGLLQPSIFSLLADAASGETTLDIWLKLDAGTPEWYGKINRTNISYFELTVKIKEFVSRAPVTLQTMLCAIDGNAPPLDEEKALEELTAELAVIAAQGKGFINKVQLYSKARSAPEDPKASPLPASYLEQRATSLRRIFTDKDITTSVEVFI
jgi:wyosine [tRNA(Phe)-imidazoG37] synthetase (radical SAM superfamily)